MFKIGDFARIAKVSVKALHHYDELGLLQPDKTDPNTGYRYYSAEQMATLNQILALKEAGFSLAEVGEILQTHRPNAQMINLLEQKAGLLETSLRAEQDRLARLRTKIFLIKNGGIPLINGITIKKVEPILVASLRATITDYEEMGGLWEDLNNYIKSQGCPKVVPCMTLYHNGWNLDKGMDIEVIEALARPLAGSGGVSTFELPSVERMACVIHSGPLKTINETYQALDQWVKKNGYKLSGPVREIYHQGEWVTDDPEEYVTEIQYPLT